MRPGTRGCGSRLALKLCPPVDTVGLSGRAKDGGEWFGDESTASAVKSSGESPSVRYRSYSILER
jgi:hypothetical protein